MTLDQTVVHMKKLVGVADYIVPNYTEAARLTGLEYHESVTSSEVEEMIQRLCDMGAKSVIITSIRLDGKDMVAGFDHETKQTFTIPFYKIPVRFPGTGDIFSAVLFGKLMEGNSLYDSTKKAMDTVSSLIEKNKNNIDIYKGIPIEQELEVLKG